MGLNKKDLNRIVAFVKKVKELPGNEEFIADLRMVLREKHEVKEAITLPSDATTTVDAASNPKIDAIEKYLGLDYQLDVATPSIDYSFVVNAEVRNQLESDYREMLRYRYGTRGHRVDFFEFCRYVQLQSEALLNYYYRVKPDAGEESSSEESDGNKTYQTLLYKFCNTNQIKSYTLDNVRNVRNMQSHRTMPGLVIDNLIAQVKEFAKNNNIKFYASTNNIDVGDIHGKNLSEKFREEFKMSEKAYNYKVRLEQFIHNTPFADVVGALSKLANTVAHNLTTE